MRCLPPVLLVLVFLLFLLFLIYGLHLGVKTVGFVVLELVRLSPVLRCFGINSLGLVMVQHSVFPVRGIGCPASATIPKNSNNSQLSECISGKRRSPLWGENVAMVVKELAGSRAGTESGGTVRIEEVCDEKTGDVGDDAISHSNESHRADVASGPN